MMNSLSISLFLVEFLMFAFSTTALAQVESENKRIQDSISIAIRQKLQKENAFDLDSYKITKHLTVLGIPITGSIATFQQKLMAKHYRLDTKRNKQLPVGQREFRGWYSGHQCSLRAYYFPDEKIVYKVRVSIKFAYELNADDAYQEIKRNLLRKYKKSDTDIKSIDGHESIHTLIIDDEDDILGCIDLIIFDGGDDYESELVVGYSDMDGFAKEEEKHTNDI